jgi:hypothetical protein
MTNIRHGFVNRGVTQLPEDVAQTIANTGIISGGALTINADPTKFDVSAGKGYIINHSVSPPIVNVIEWDAFTSQTVTNLATSFATDIAINSLGVILQQDTYTNSELRSVILLGGLDHSNNTSILNTFEIQVPAEAVGSSLKELSKAIGDINISGNVFSANGANLKLNKSSGSAFKFGANNISVPNDPHIISQISLTQAPFSYVYNDGSGKGVFQAQTTDVNPTNYDNGSGTLVSTTGNNFTIQRILLFPNANTVFIQYGTQVYNNLASAISGLSTQNYVALNGIRTATVRGYLIVRANATALNNSAQALFVEADRFGGIGARDGGGGSVNWGNILGTLSDQTDLQTTLNGKQDTLVSATNIKTINGSSVLGSGDLVVSGSGASWGSITGTLSSQTDLQTALDGKVNDAGNETIAGDKTFSGKLIMSGNILQVKDYDTTGSYISFDDDTNTEVGGIYHDATGDLVDIYATKELRLESNTEIVFASPTINMATSSKVTPLDADTVYIKDTASVNEVKQTTWSNVKVFLKTYFDTLYQATIINGFGLTGTTTKAVALTSAEAFITAETTLSTTAYADITGASITLDAGTWLIMATVNGASQTTTATSMIVAITDSANALVAQSAQDIPAGTATVRTWANLSISAIVTPASSTTYKLRGARGQTTRTGNWIASDGTGQGTANNGSNNSDKSTSIRAIRIA